MPLSEPDYQRVPLHKRSINIQAYERADGMFDLEAQLLDTKDYDFPLHDGKTHKAGKAIHNMLLRITIDADYNVVAAQACFEAAPYGQFCSAIAPEYQQLVGLNLLNKFRKAVRARFGRTAGCTHLTELCDVLPTAAVQTMSGRRRVAAEKSPESERKPFQLDGCHALRTDGPVVKAQYIKWYRPDQQGKSANTLKTQAKQ